ncbi:D-glycero-alpha-D-manno-heptose-1,7-bisphosphate 7-phosphatase [Clostridium sp. UBA6640]|uniref:D-glycero-alpha-D-manno-heptose-1,7-bisphosphate 7-phosphatase n=1 Tax=Clostridium sp. UBA6640 TaxID=1946370 RepID=UPI0025C46D4B|nr:HAD-IIIA family hydrolase [Clostridium sp. UBA6640]
MDILNKAVFLDMQGTLGGTGVDDIRSFDFYPFSIEAIKKLNKNGILSIIITNQSNISRGYLSQEYFDNKMNFLKKRLKEEGAYIDGVYCCPHTREDKCNCKKPLTGLIDMAVQDFNIDLKNSFVVGDMGMSDIILSKKIGAKGVLVLTGTGKGSLTEFRDTWINYEADYIAENVLEAANWILNLK